MAVLEIESEVSKQKSGDVVIITLSGKMVIDREQFQVMKLVNDELAKGHKFFLIDLQEVSTIDSSGVGELFAIRTAVDQKKGQLRIVHLDDHVGKVIQMAQLHRMVETYDDQDKAIAAFG